MEAFRMLKASIELRNGLAINKLPCLFETADSCLENTFLCNQITLKIVTSL